MADSHHQRRHDDRRQNSMTERRDPPSMQVHDPLRKQLIKTASASRSADSPSTAGTCFRVTHDISSSS